MRRAGISTALAAVTAATALAILPARPAGAYVGYLTGRVSVADGGGQAPQGSNGTVPQVSSDGRFVAFSSGAALIKSDVNGASDVYLRDRAGGTTSRVSLTDGDAQIDGPSWLCGMSRDARYVGFVGMGANLGPAGNRLQVWRRDRQLGTTVLISQSTSGSPSDLGNGTSGVWVDPVCPISDDGRYVAFVSEAANLAGGDGNGAGTDVFRRDVLFGATDLISRSAAGFGSSASSAEPAISGDGSVVAFSSSAGNLVPGDTNSTDDVFVRLPATNQTQRVSLTTGGAQLTLPSTSPVLSKDGNKVAFVSAATNLVAGDTNAHDDVFIRNRATSAVARASLAPDGGQLLANASAPDMDDDGTAVTYSAYFSDDQPGDTNHEDDVYLRHLTSQNVVRVSDNADGVAGNNQSYANAISGDGTTVAFASNASDLVRNDTNGKEDVFVRDEQVVFDPFDSIPSFVLQQYRDFEGRNPTTTEWNGWTLAIQSGERAPDELIDDLAHGTTWSAKRAPLTRLYWAFFLRAPDTGGMGYWTNQLVKGKKLAQVAKQFSTSSEFQNKYGALSNPAFVTKIYQNIFERNPDPGGLAYWTKKLDTKQKTRGDVMVSFSESSEGRRRLAPQVDVVLLWLGMLRTMPPKAQLAPWMTDIRSGAKVAEHVAEHLRTLPAYAALVNP